MRIRKILIISLALIICLTGCAKQKISFAENENSFSASETVTEQSSIETDESVTVTETEVSNTPTDNTSATFKSTENSTKHSTQAEEKTSYVPPKESSTQRYKPVESTRPSISPTQPTKPVTSPSTTVPPVQDFDIDYWIRYAKSYAQSVGLRLDSTATNCWDNPISANPKRKNLEQDIQSRLNRYARDTDITNVWIWAEKVSDNSYEIYIGYA